ncbi:MAG TPA: DUF2911 domain-containing protein [Gemmatimonadaceae bacterium]|nr:DUF2911 domain-containing protein [Gemmatimonadaceae bacterium]
MSAKTTAATLVLFASTSLAAQAPATAYIVTRLGVDTVAIERYTRSGGKLEGDLVLRYPRVRTYHYVADLGPRGEIKSITTTVRRASTDPGAPPVMQFVGRFGDTLAVLEVQRGGRPDTAASGSKVYRGAVAPMLGVEPTSYGIYEQLLSSAKLGRDSVSYALIGPGSGPTPAIILRRRGVDSVSFTSTFFPGWTEVARVDSRGQIMGVDATATTVKTVAQRVTNLDLDNVLKAWAATEVARGGMMGQMSPPDTTKATIGGANIVVAYSRPLKRGRVIFGNLVPWNQVWRTGANAATMFTTDKDLVFGTTVVPAGKYTLWTLPTPTGAKLIINSETGQWGTDYHADKDFTRLDLTTRQVSPPLEQFVIGVVPQGSGGLLRFAWDDREYGIPFTVK